MNWHPERKTETTPVMSEGASLKPVGQRKMPLVE